MRMYRSLILVFVLPAAAALLPLAFGQQPDSQIYFSRQRRFQIPFNIPANADRLKQLQLFFSTDEGRSWHPDAVAPPDAPPKQRYFEFTCERDGLYWFTVQTLDKQGNYFPASMQGARPSIKVLVDTLPPVVQLQALPADGGRVGVRWEIREEHLDPGDPEALRLEYRVKGQGAWQALPINRAATEYSWSPGTRLPLEVRLRVLDQAKNLGEDKIEVRADDGQPAGDPLARDPGAEPPAPLPHGYAQATNRRLINSRKVSLKYKLSDVGPSQVSEIELWYTLDGRSWNRYPLSGGEKVPNPVEFTVEREGVYGFTLIAKSGVGRSVRPPQIGDPPQIWVEVDETRPAVKLQTVIVGQGVDKGEGRLTIQWSAADKNLGKNPISLSYAEELNGQWFPIVSNIPNSGRYVWSMPQTVPYQFYLRVEAADLAGNTGQDTTRERVKVDLSLPKVNILEVAPGG